MKHYKIVLLKGDGIGPEIVDEAVKVLDKAALEFNFSVTYDYADLGGVAIDRTGVPLPDVTIEKCKAASPYSPVISWCCRSRSPPRSPAQWRRRS